MINHTQDNEITEYWKGRKDVVDKLPAGVPFVVIPEEKYATQLFQMVWQRADLGAACPADHLDLCELGLIVKHITHPEGRKDFYLLAVEREYEEAKRQQELLDAFNKMGEE